MAATPIGDHISGARRRTRPLVLLIEDNLTHLDLYSLILQDEVDVVPASRGETGLAVAITERPDAIIVDVLLPDADGLALCQRLREHPETAAIPLIVLTGDDVAYDRAAELRFLGARKRRSRLRGHRYTQNARHGPASTASCEPSENRPCGR